NYETIVNTKVFLEELKKTIPDNTRDNNDIPRGIDFFIEDLVGRVEKLIKQKEEAEKTNKPTDNSPDSSFSPQYQSNLVAEIKQLQDQVNDLENKVNKTTDPTEKNTYQDMLDNAKKNLGDKEKEKERWKKKTPVSPNKNDNKLNLAVGLGM
ncbi:9853_t:CDS:1, partial [Racocetra persica]